MTLEVQSLWVGNRLSRMEHYSIKSFLKLGYKFILYTYEPVANIPKGTTVKNGNKIIPKQEILNKLGTIKSKQEIYHEALIEKILVIKELIGNNSEYLIFIQDIEGIINYFKASNLPHIQNIKSLDSNNMFQF